VVEFRHGRNVGGRCFFPGNLHADLSEAEIMSAFLGQYYAERLPPAEILLSQSPGASGAVEGGLDAQARGQGGPALAGAR
jgi:excinuclease ABC subunit C